MQYVFVNQDTKEKIYGYGKHLEVLMYKAYLDTYRYTGRWKIQPARHLRSELMLDLRVELIKILESRDELPTF